MENLETREGDVAELDLIPAGAGCAGRAETEKNPDAVPGRKFPRRRTVKGRKTRRNRKRKNPGGRAGNGKNAGQHIRPGIVEAAEILITEGYVVGKVINPGLPFDLIGYRRDTVIFLQVVRPKQDVTNAGQAAESYRNEIKELMPYRTCDTDNIQFWVFSREKGLLRYQVFNGLIGNVETMQKIMLKKQETKPVQETADIKNEIRRTRDAPCPATQTGNAGAPVGTPAQAGIPSKDVY